MKPCKICYRVDVDTNNRPDQSYWHYGRKYGWFALNDPLRPKGVLHSNVAYCKTKKSAFRCGNNLATVMDKNKDNGASFITRLRMTGRRLQDRKRYISKEWSQKVENIV